MRNKGEKGFTLVELMVVIVILGILACILIPVVTGAINDAKVSKDKADLVQMNKLVEMYKLTTGLYDIDADAVLTAIKNDGNYDLIADAKGYGYWFNMDTKRVEYHEIVDLSGVQFNNGRRIKVVYANNTNNLVGRHNIGQIHQNSQLIYIEQSKTELTKAMEQIRGLASFDASDLSALQIDYEDKFEASVDSIRSEGFANIAFFIENNFHPSNTIYISSNATLVSNSSNHNIVFDFGVTVISNNFVSINQTQIHNAQLIDSNSMAPLSFEIPSSVCYIEKGAFGCFNESVNNHVEIFSSKIQFSDEKDKSIFSLVNAKEIVVDKLSQLEYKNFFSYMVEKFSYIDKNGDIQYINYKLPIKVNDINNFLNKDNQTNENYVFDIDRSLFDLPKGIHHLSQMTLISRYLEVKPIIETNNTQSYNMETSYINNNGVIEQMVMAFDCDGVLVAGLEDIGHITAVDISSKIQEEQKQEENNKWAVSAIDGEEIKDKVYSISYLDSEGIKYVVELSVTKIELNYSNSSWIVVSDETLVVKINCYCLDSSSNKELGEYVRCLIVKKDGTLVWVEDIEDTLAGSPKGSGDKLLEIEHYNSSNEKIIDIIIQVGSLDAENDEIPIIVSMIEHIDGDEKEGTLTLEFTKNDNGNVESFPKITTSIPSSSVTSQSYIDKYSLRIPALKNFVGFNIDNEQNLSESFNDIFLNAEMTVKGKFVPVFSLLKENNVELSASQENEIENESFLFDTHDIYEKTVPFDISASINDNMGKANIELNSCLPIFYAQKTADGYEVFEENEDGNAYSENYLPCQLVGEKQIIIYYTGIFYSYVEINNQSVLCRFEYVINTYLFAPVAYDQNGNEISIDMATAKMLANTEKGIEIFRTIIN